ncbi:MAG: hypothetical protein H0V04_04515 [Chloroflexi bacterium]|nr:hypothetical protein [Chloroflexota bacterium]
MKRNILEWVVLAVSALALAGVVGLLALESFQERRPPDPVAEVHLDEARDGSLGWIVPVTITNNGDVASEQLVIEGTATVDGEEETSEIDVDFLPAGTSVEGEFSFSAEPESVIGVRFLGQRLP